jgi:hypothetical protein
MELVLAAEGQRGTEILTKLCPLLPAANPNLANAFFFMQTSLSWLSTHLDLSSYTTAQLSDLLTFAGVEVEGIEERGVTTDKVVVAQISPSSSIRTPTNSASARSMTAAALHARSSAVRRISKRATKCPSHSQEPFCPADSPSKKANCAASIPWA